MATPLLPMSISLELNLPNEGGELNYGFDINISCEVVDVTLGSSASRVGLMRGLRLLNINGTDCINRNHCFTLLKVNNIITVTSHPTDGIYTGVIMNIFTRNEMHSRKPQRKLSILPNMPIFMKDLWGDTQAVFLGYLQYTLTSKQQNESISQYEEGLSVTFHLKAHKLTTRSNSNSICSVMEVHGLKIPEGQIRTGYKCNKVLNLCEPVSKLVTKYHHSKTGRQVCMVDRQEVGCTDPLCKAPLHIPELFLKPPSKGIKLRHILTSVPDDVLGLLKRQWIERRIQCDISELECAWRIHNPYLEQVCYVFYVCDVM